MIDWIKAVIPWRHSQALNDGQVLSISRNGDIEWNTNKRLAVRGSHDSALHILSDNRERDSETGDFLNVIIDGNPIKFLQGHNLFGSDDLVGLVAEICLRVSKALQMPIPENNWQTITEGFYHLKRIDSTAMLCLGNDANVESALYSIETTGHMRYKGQAIATKGTVYFGKHSRRESLKFYNKLTEIQAKGHRLPLEIELLPGLIPWVTGKLRVEHTLRTMQLKHIGLDLAVNWRQNKPLEVLMDCMSAMKISSQHTLTDTALDHMPSRLKPIYQLWKDGHDLRKIYPKVTFYRYRKQLQELASIDIAIKQGNRQERSPNVVDFVRVLTPELVSGVPEFAIGTSLYFEPRARSILKSL